MLNNDKGISLVESMIAVFLTAIAIMSLLPMQSTSIRAAANADYLGRAAGIMQSELEAQEAFVMNSTNVIVDGTQSRNVTVSDIVGVQGDVTYTVATTTTTITPLMSARIHVRVTWPGSNTGIKSSLIVTRQSGFQ